MTDSFRTGKTLARMEDLVHESTAELVRMSDENVTQGLIRRYVQVVEQIPTESGAKPFKND